MRQMITRLDDGLHARLKAKAAADGRSANDLVVEAISRILGEASPRQVVRARLAAKGKLMVPPRPAQIPTRKEAWAAGRGAGTAVSEALEAERNESW
jgi:plasmid stability protein